jgi:hypothetical protein
VSFQHFLHRPSVVLSERLLILQDIAIKLIKRIKGLFASHGIYFDSKEIVLELNGCSIEAYPSNHLDAYRSLTNPKFILLDEADFFRKLEQQHKSKDIDNRTKLDALRLINDCNKYNKVPGDDDNETPRQGIGNQDQGHPAAHGAFNAQFEEEDAENVEENC